MDVQNGDIKKYYIYNIFKQNNTSDVCVEFTISRGKSDFNYFIATTFVLLFSVLIGLHYSTNFQILFSQRNSVCIIILLLTCAFLFVKMVSSVRKESLLVIVPIGIQFTTTFAFGKQAVMFIPWGAVNDVLIIDVITGQKVLFYLAVSIRKSQGREGLVVLFQNTRPRLACLQEIYRTIQQLLKYKENWVHSYQ